MINESKILELIRRQKDTGLTVTAFCANEDIPKPSFYFRRKKLSNKPGKNFIPLLVNSTPVTMMETAKNHIVSRNEHHIPCDDFLLELSYPDGTRLRIRSSPDLDNLRSLVCLLD
jgi:hypothetical protein